MNISLTPHLEKLVQAKVQSGLYTSASEFLREALRSFLAKEQEEYTLTAAEEKGLAISLQQIKNGKCFRGTYKEAEKWLNQDIEKNV